MKFYTELTTGLRLGEICGLMWSDFNGRKGTLSVSRTLHREKGGRLTAGDTKTYAGTRTILLPTSTAERLRLRKKTSYSPWIFHDPLRPEAPLNPGTAYRQLKKTLQETRLPELRFHDLRHTFATHALATTLWPMAWMPRPCPASWAIPRPASPWTSTPTPPEICRNGRRKL